MEIKINSLEDTKKLGRIIGHRMEKGCVLCLDGDLGSGKTTLTQSIAEGLDVKDYVTSPTFTIIKEYQGRLPLYHMDVYRIGSADDMYDLGFDEYIYSQGVTVIEWSHKIEEILPENRVSIIIRKTDPENSRMFDLTGSGYHYRYIAEALEKYENISD